MEKSLELLDFPESRKQNLIYVYMLDRIYLKSDSAVISDDNLRSLKQLSVLCYLILHRNRSVSQAELIDVFWSDEESKNPRAALKVLILRIRDLLEPLCANPILSRRGAYQWNPDIPCAVDAEIFEKLCQTAAMSGTPTERKAEMYMEAMKLYRGNLLPKMAGQQWLIPISSRYHDCYSVAVKEYAQLLEEKGKYREMGQLTLYACNLLPLEEQLHTQVIRSYILQKKYYDALEHYKKATRAMYQALGIPPSEQMQAVYAQIMSEEKNSEENLDAIMSDMSGAVGAKGALFCEYGMFKMFYQLESRRMKRNSDCLHVVLITLKLSSEAARKAANFNQIMELLQAEILDSLRLGDVVAQYNKSQIIFMLPNASYEDSGKVVERILKSFYSKYPKSFFNIHYTIRGLEPCR